MAEVTKQALLALCGCLKLFLGPVSATRAGRAIGAMLCMAVHMGVCVLMRAFWPMHVLTLPCTSNMHIHQSFGLHYM